MATLNTLARPYAKAAFEYAKEQGFIGEWESFLSIAGHIVTDEAFAQLLYNPVISYDKKATLLLDICMPSNVNDSPVRQILGSVTLPDGVDVDSLMKKISSGTSTVLFDSLKNFIMQLAQHDRLTLLPEIEQHFGKLKSEELRQIDAHIVSAYPLTDEQRVMLQKSLAERENAVVILHETVDRSLLGGATIKVGDKFTDGSVRGRLTQLKAQLI